MFLTKLIINVGLRQEQKFLRLLAKIEFGVSIFCKKLAVVAEQENKLNLAAQLKLHAKQEEKHGIMLLCLADGNRRFTLEGTGRFIELLRPNGEDLRCNVDLDAEGKIVEWDSTIFPGERLVGIFENFELSKRFCCLRLLFGNKSAFDYNWDDRLAFMFVLEQQTQQFYQLLAVNSTSIPLRIIASKIALDELNHTDYLKNVLFHYNGDVEKWRDRFWFAQIGLVFDAWKFTNNKSWK